MNHEIVKATIALFTFKRYTDFPRFLEIAMSLFAWYNLGIVLWSIYNIAM